MYLTLTHTIRDFRKAISLVVPWWRRSVYLSVLSTWQAAAQKIIFVLFVQKIQRKQIQFNVTFATISCARCAWANR